jgi:glycosyltransferase involved in cell wall biosynthesis
MATISIVIPARNEQENIGSLIREIEQLSLPHPHEIVIVDDASSDGTCAVALSLKEIAPSLRIVRHDRSYGQSAAIATGIRHAAGTLIVTMDGDGQNDPADLPKMIEALVSSSNPRLRMIAGFRKRRHDSAWRILCSKVANAVRGSLLGDHTPDTGCGLKVFYRSAFLSLPCFDHMHRFLPALIQMQGGEVLSLEVSHRARKHGSSKYGTLDRLWVGLVDLVGVRWLRLRVLNITISECH